MSTGSLPHEALLTLTQWLSAGYPVAAFACSHGLEWAGNVGDVTDADSLCGRLSGLLTDGARA